MTKTLDTKTYAIGSLLGRYERRGVVLPPFQRSYSWEKVQVSQFWDDLIIFESEFAKSPKTASYFLGSIVVIEQENQILLLDGQQRLATATIAFAAMRDSLRALDKGTGTKGADTARDIQRELIEKDTEPITYALTLGELDEPYFAKAIKQDPPSIPATKLRSHLLIQSAYSLLSDRITERLKGRTYDDSVDSLKSLHNVLSKGMTLIGIIVQDEEDAYTIFETLNDRGLRLSVPDLVLNLLMRRAPDATARALVRQHWNTMIRQMGRRDVSRFLRHMWVSRFGDLKTEGLYVAIRKNLETSKLKSVEFAEQCADECDSYVALLDINIPASKEVLRNLDGIVRYLQITSAPPLLLAGHRCLNSSDFGKLLEMILATYIRFALATNQNPLDFESASYEAARTIRSMAAAGKSSAEQNVGAKIHLQKLATEDTVVRQGAADLSLERGEAVWLMAQLANSMQSATKEIGMDKANLEHVFPQNPGADWPNKDDLESFTWHIGNLTILGEQLNRKAQNKGFSDKVSQYYTKSEIEMTKQVATFPVWNSTAVKKRAVDLAAKLAATWPAVK